MALIGNAFANCKSTKTVTQTITGSTTITDNWSVTTRGMFGVFLNELEVTTTVGGSKAVTMSQSIEFDIEPGMQVGHTHFP